MNIQSLWNGFTQFQQNFLQRFQHSGMKNVVSAMQNNNMTRQQTPKKAPENLVKTPAAVASFSSYGMSRSGGGGPRYELNNCQSWIVDDTAKGEGTAFAINRNEIRLVQYDTTEDDAIWRQMQQAGPQITREGLESGAQIKLGTPTRAELDSYRELLRKQGGNLEIDWGRLNVDLMFEGSGVGSEEITNKADYFASRYVAAKSKLESNFTGDALVSRLETLDTMYQSAVDKMARQYAEETGRFYEENGFAGETEKFYQSVLAGVSQRRDELMQFAAANSDYAGLVGSKDEWLLQDDAYMATRLRAAAGPMDTIAAKPDTMDTVPENIGLPDEVQEGDALYSLRDLDAAAKFVKELPEDMIGGVHSDEESLGLDLAILTMKTQVFTEAASIGESMQNFIKSSILNYQEKALNAIDAKLFKQSQDDTLEGNAEGCPALDRSAIKSVYDKTMEAYKTTGSFAEALKVGGEYGHQKYIEKSNSTEYNKAYRYTGNEYWDAFYTTIQAPNPYYGKVPTSQLYKQNWNEMMESFQSGNISDFRLGLSGLGAIPHSNASRFGTPAANWTNEYDNLA